MKRCVSHGKEIRCVTKNSKNLFTENTVQSNNSFLEEEINDKLKHMARKVGRSVAAWYGSGAPVEWTLTSPLSLGVGPTAGRMMRFHRKRLRHFKPKKDKNN